MKRYLLIIVRYVNAGLRFLPTFFKRQKPAERQEKEKRAEQSPIGEEPERLYVNPYGNIESIEEWATRWNVQPEKRNPEFIAFLREILP